MDEYIKLIEKLRRIEALYNGATTAGERDAAAAAHERIKERLASVKIPEPVKEYRFSLENTWSRKLFVALLRRYGYNPYRYPRQRYTSVMVRLTDRDADSLWREFQELNDALREHLDALAEKVIREAVSTHTEEAEEVPVIQGAITYEE